jgi:hypothetical protein
MIRSYESRKNSELKEISSLIPRSNTNEGIILQLILKLALICFIKIHSIERTSFAGLEKERRDRGRGILRDINGERLVKNLYS